MHKQINAMYTAVMFFFALMLPSVYVLAEDFISPPNGRHYAVNVIDPQVQACSDHVAIGQFFAENGYVVIEAIADVDQREKLVQLMDHIVAEDIPLARRLGFMDLYHDDTLAQLRQDPRVYAVFAHLLGTEKLWVVFDRVIYQKRCEGEDPLPPHVDQNPVTHPHFFNVQGMVALRTMDESTGTLALVPKSPHFFHEYAAWTKPGDGYVEYQGERSLNFVALRLQAGQMVIWDSRTTHSRFRGIPSADRYAALITFTKAAADPALLTLRRHYFEAGIGCNNHEAGLRATARPRCEESLRHERENLTALGRKLYGLESWD